MKITLVDGNNVPDAENQAMLQALLSRDPTPVEEQIEKNKNADKFFENYVVKYGHGSIAQCGNIVLFYKDVSMRLAKIIQFHNYYNGQETSSRYFDFSKYGEEDLVYFDQKTLNNQLTLLTQYKEAIIKWKDEISIFNFGKSYNLLSNQEQKMVNPKAFDRARGYLPFGSKTSVSWTTNFDNLWKHLSFIKANFKDPESQMFVDSTLSLVRSKYPSSLPELVGETGTGASRESLNNETRPLLTSNDFFDDISTSNLGFNWASFGKQPELIEVTINKSQIDIGCWRDIQRHRNTTQSWPDVVIPDSYHSYYNFVPVAKFNNHFDAPLASMINYNLKMSLAQMHYIIRARYQETVHPIIRTEMLKWINMLKRERLPLPKGLRQSVLDSIPGCEESLALSIKRAEQTIERK